MPDKNYYVRDKVNIPSRCKTKDGDGLIIARKMKKGSNDGPGNLVFIVKLDDGRTRNYSRNSVEI